MEKKLPWGVSCLLDAVSQKLGREACVRPVKNENSYFVLDKAFSYFQKADNNKQVGYRAGYHFHHWETQGVKNLLTFDMVHSPVMFSFFRQNFDYERFRKIMEDTAEFRCNYHYLHYVVFNKERTQKEKFEIIRSDIADFLKEIDAVEEKYGFAKRIFANKNSSKHYLGNTFYVNLAQNFFVKDIPNIVDKTWDLFMWLYPSKPLFKRDASLNRSMQKIECKCEFRAIQGLPQEILDAECDGIVQAAHIKPHHKGGSDKLTNGLWLCERHHRMTEGKLTGSRDLEHIDVKYRP